MITISEVKYPLENLEEGTMVVFIYSGKGDPRKNLDNAIKNYVGDNYFYELMLTSLDNPWMRVIMSDINNMVQEEYKFDKHKFIN